MHGVGKVMAAKLEAMDIFDCGELRQIELAVLIKKFGKPIVSTSANISEEKTPKSFKEISTPILEGVDYIVNLHQNKINTKSSTILKVDGTDILVLRE